MADQPIEKKYVCRWCQRSFARPDHVQRHERRHTKETPYRCDCGQAFTRHDLLTRHQKLTHQIEPVKRRKYQHLPDIAEPLGHPQALQGPTAGPHAPSTAVPDAIVIPQAPPPDNAAQPAAFASEDGPVDWLNSGVSGVGTETSKLNALDTAEAYARPADAVSLGEAVNLDRDYALDTTMLQEDVDNTLAGNNMLNFGLPHFDMQTFFDSGDFLPEDFHLPSPSGFGLAKGDHLSLATPASVIESTGPQSVSATSDQQQHHRSLDSQAAVQESNIFSRLGSPLPSLGALSNLESPSYTTLPAKSSSQPWRVSQDDHVALQVAVESHKDILSSSFTLPSRHTITHYIERCINSLYKHQPCVHRATFRIGSSSLELILAMCAVGAQLRFESGSGVTFFHASKAIIMTRLQDLHKQSTVDRLLQPQFRSSNGSHRPVLPLDTKQSETRIQTMQALLTLMSFGSWGPKSLLAETMTLQSMLAMLAREEGLGYEAYPDLDESLSLESKWSQWIRIETLRRIKTISYYFTNLQSLAYNMPPPILTAELQCYTPVSAIEWAAPSANRWDEARKSSGIVAMPFHRAFEQLFRGTSKGSLPVDAAQTQCSISAMGGYALIFGILQYIYYIRQRHPFMASLSSAESSAYPTAVPPADFDALAMALQRWQHQWETCPESTIEPESSAGPISFNAIACLRMAWFRLYCDIGPCRNLATREPAIIARMFAYGPSVHRHPQLTPVLLQAIHALSVPVRLGVKFVSRSQTMFWSVNQSLCTLECAFVLHKWFDALQSGITSAPLSEQEKKLLSLLNDIVLESGLFEEDPLLSSGFLSESHQQQAKARSTPSFHGSIHDASFHKVARDWLVQDTPGQTPFATATGEDATTMLLRRQISLLASYIARLWAEVFSNNHVFDLTTIIGKTLSLRTATPD